MAFQQGFVDPDGSTHPEAYFRIINVNLDYYSQEGLVRVLIYHNQQSRQDKKDACMEYQFAFGPQKVVDPMDATKVTTHSFSDVFASTALDKANPLKAAYTYLRALPQFESAKDN